MSLLSWWRLGRRYGWGWCPSTWWFWMPLECLAGCFSFYWHWDNVWFGICVWDGYIPDKWYHCDSIELFTSCWFFVSKWCRLTWCGINVSGCFSCSERQWRPLVSTSLSQTQCNINSDFIICKFESHGSNWRCVKLITRVRSRSCFVSGVVDIGFSWGHLWFNIYILTYWHVINAVYLLRWFYEDWVNDRCIRGTLDVLHNNLLNGGWRSWTPCCFHLDSGIINNESIGQR